MLAICLLLLLRFDASTGVECPNGYSTHDNNCYLYVGDLYTWFEAQVACWSMGTRLVEIETEEENAFIGAMIHSRGATYAWSGMTDFAEEGTFVLSSTQTRVPYSNWKPGEPNDHYGTQSEDCVFIAADSTWLDAQCHNYREPFICEMPDGETAGPIIG